MRCDQRGLRWDEIKCELNWLRGNGWDEMRWDGKEWDVMRWHDLRWNGTIWDETRWNGMTWDKMGWDEMRWNGIITDELRWDKRRWDEMKWEEKRWDEIGQNGMRTDEMGEDLGWNGMTWGETKCCNIWNTWLYYNISNAQVVIKSYKRVQYEVSDVEVISFVKLLTRIRCCLVSP